MYTRRIFVFETKNLACNFITPQRWWHFDIFSSKKNSLLLQRPWRIQIRSSPSFYVFIYSMYKASIRIINLLLLLYLYLHICCLVITLQYFFAQYYICISNFKYWQHIKVKQELTLYNGCQICFHICTICVIQCVFHAWLTLAFLFL